MIRRLVSLGIIAALCACSGGGGRSVGGLAPTLLPSPIAAAKPTPAPPAPVPSIAPYAAPTITNVVVTIDDGGDTTAQAISRRIQSRGRSAQYVSPSSLGIQVSASGYTTQAFDVSAGSPLCTGSGAGRTCTLGVNVKPGSYTFTMGLYDKKPVGGVISSANLLGISTLSKTITANATNTLNFFISGEVHTLSNSTSYGSLPGDGTARSIAVLFLAQDYGNNTIATTGSTPYANPITVSLLEGGGTGHSYLTINGTAVGSSGTITQASDAVRIVYDGGASSGYSTLASFSASTSSSSSYRMSPLYVSGSASPASASASATVTITEANAPGGVGYAQSLSGNCAGQATSSGGGTGASGSATVTDAQLPPGGVACTLTISDNLGSAVAVPANIPPGTPVCSSYPNGRQLSPQDYSNGSPCGLAVSPTTLTIYTPGDGTHPTSASFSMSEANTANSIVINSNCAPNVLNSISPASTGTAGALATTSFTATASSPVAVGTCTATVTDGNGQSVPVTINVASSGPTYYYQNQSDGGSGAANCTLNSNGIDYNCSTYAYSLNTFTVPGPTTVTVTENYTGSNPQFYFNQSTITNHPNPGSVVVNVGPPGGTSLSFTQSVSLPSAGSWTLLVSATCNEYNLIPQSSTCDGGGFSGSFTISSP